MANANGSAVAGITAEQIQNWKAEYGRIIGIDDPIPMIFRKPTRPIWADFVEHVSKNKGQTEANYRRLCLACLVYPDLHAAEQAFDDMPGLGMTIGDELGELCGHKGGVDVKKL